MNKRILSLVFCAPFLLLSACCDVAKTQPQQMKAIGLQLYSLRDAMKTDAPATIAAIGKIGYAYAEAAGYADGKFYGMPPEEFKRCVENAGMKALSSHTTRQLSEQELAEKNLSTALAWWSETIDAHAAAGIQYIVCPWMNVPKTLADLQTYCDYYNAIGKLCKERGLLFGYHNHAHEFTQVDGQSMYDYMLEHTNPEYVFFQMDVYWAVVGKQSPVEYFGRYPGRFALLHIKDKKELGQSGMVGFDAILRNLETAGTQYLIVEVEQYNFAPEESVKRSLDYLRQLPVNLTKE
jgi:sugar phosphate isomerase/epimerase